MVVERVIRSVGPMVTHALPRVSYVDLSRSGQALTVASPTTYMNESGLAVAQLARRLGVAAAYLLVVHDELDLPIGTLRLKRGGGDGGHRGLRSITEHLGSADYARLRIGIGRPDETFVGTVADFVLEAVPLADRAALNSSVDRAVEVTMLCADVGYAAAMNLVNQR
jgi:PTH1 family peptidyl-tRNA hydrolase